MTEDNSNKESKGESSKEEGKKLTDDEIFELKKKEYLEDLNTNPKYKEVFDNYLPSSLDSFKIDYTLMKANLFLYGKFYIKLEEESVTKYYKAAQKRFWDIQQKKLFDLQCRWRAEEIKIPGIEVCADFESWGQHISICPFLPPVTQHEFDLYIEFISLNGIKESYEWIYNWQDYEEFKENFEKDCETDDCYPLWYKYHDSMMNLDYMHKLRDIRGEKEEFYLDIIREIRQKGNEEKNKGKPPIVYDKRPGVHDDPNSVIEFIELFEDAKLLKMHKALTRSYEADDDEVLNEAIKTLETADETMDMNFNDNWRRGILTAADKYKTKRIIKELKKYYNDYLFRLNINLPMEDTYDKETDTAAFKIQWRKEDILKAREIRGEPGDFNF